MKANFYHICLEKRDVPYSGRWKDLGTNMAGHEESSEVRTMYLLTEAAPWQHTCIPKIPTNPSMPCFSKFNCNLVYMDS